MEGIKTTAVFFCNSSNGDYDIFDISELVSYAENLIKVNSVWLNDDIPVSPDLVSRKIKKDNIKRVVIAGRDRKSVV